VLEELVQDAFEQIALRSYDEALRLADEALKLDARHAGALYARVFALRKLGRSDETQATLDDALAHHPEHLGLHIEQGWLHCDRRDYALAHDSFAAALAIDADSEHAHVGAVACRRWARDFAGAQEAAAAALDRHPHSAPLLNEQAFIFFDQNQHREALGWLAKSLEQSPADETALVYTVVCHRQLDDYAAAQAAVTRALELVPGAPSLLNQQAHVHLEQSRYHEALEWFGRTLAQLPRDEVALEWSVTCQRRLGDFAAAQVIATRALELLPDRPRLLNEQAFLYFDQAQYGAARDFFARALALVPTDETALAWTVTCHRRLKEFDAAQAAVARGLALLPDRPILLNEQAFLHFDRTEYRAALEGFARTLERAPTDETALVWTATCHRFLKDFAAAQASVSAALRALPGRAVVLKEQAFVHFDQGRQRDALEFLGQVLAQTPNDETALRWTIACLRAVEDYAAADAAAERALAALPDRPVLLNERAFVHFDRLRYRDALACFARTLALAPADETALRWTIACHRALQEFDSAESVGRAAVELAPHSAAILVELALVNEDRTRWDAADEQFAAAARLDPKVDEVWAGRIRCSQRLRGSNGVRDLMRELPSEVRASAQVQLACGQALLDQGDLAEAEAALERAAAASRTWLAPVSSLATLFARTGRFAEGVARLEQLRALLPKSEEVGEALAFLHLRANDAHGALAELESLRSANPKSLIARNGVASVKFETGDWESAAEGFGALAAEWPDLLVLTTNHARALSRMGRPEDLEQARALCDEVRRRQPCNSSAFECLGVVYYKLGRWNESEAMLRRAIDLDRLGGPYRDLGSLYAKQARYDEAKANLQRALELNPFDTRARIELGSLYLEMKESRSGLAELRRAVSTDRGNADAIQALAQGLMQEGDLRRAEHELREGIRRVDPSASAGLHVWLARLLTQLAANTSDETLAREALENATLAVRLRPMDTEGYFEQGMAYNALGAPEQALRSFSRVLAISEDHPEAERNVERLKRLRRAERRSQRAESAGYYVSGGSAVLLVLLWTLYLLPGLLPGPDSAGRIDPTMMLTFTPLLLGLVIIGLVLPFLSKLRLPGVEAELQQTQASIGAGPSGQLATQAPATSMLLVTSRTAGIGMGPR
jgi:tetratricopeptide (TPR) repeat protein